MRLFIFIFVPLFLFSQEYIRSYSYQASETQSRQEARQAALETVKRLFIEELGVSVSSSFTKELKLKNNQVKKELRSHYKSQARAHIATRILNERWDGKIFWIEVAFKTLQKGAQLDKKRAFSCSENRETISKLLLKEEANALKQAIHLALRIPFTNSKCADIHYTLINRLLAHKLFHQKYRNFLLQTLQSIEHLDRRKAYAILSYILHFKLDAPLLKHLTASLKKFQASTLRGVYTLFIAHGLKYNTFHTILKSLKSAIEYNSKLTLSQELDEFFSHFERFYEAKNFKEFKILIDFYTPYAHEADNASIINALKYLFGKMPTHRKELIAFAQRVFKAMTPSHKAQNALYYFTQYLTQQEKRAFFKALDKEISALYHQDQPLSSYEIKQIITYDLSDKRGVPSLESCYKEIGTDPKNDIKYASFIVSYQNANAPYKAQLFKALIRTHYKKSYEALYTLLQVLAYIDYDDTARLKTLLKFYLKEKNEKRSIAYKKALLRYKKKSLALILHDLPHAPLKEQKKLIGLLGFFTPEVKTHLKELKAIVKKEPRLQDDLDYLESLL